jgi:hypothetical protein
VPSPLAAPNRTAQSPCERDDMAPV